MTEIDKVIERISKLKIGCFGSESGTTLHLKEMHNQEIDGIIQSVTTLLEEREREIWKIVKLRIDYDKRHNITPEESIEDLYNSAELKLHPTK